MFLLPGHVSLLVCVCVKTFGLKKDEVNANPLNDFPGRVAFALHLN